MSLDPLARVSLRGHDLRVNDSTSMIQSIPFDIAKEYIAQQFLTTFSIFDQSPRCFSGMMKTKNGLSPSAWTSRSKLDNPGIPEVRSAISRVDESHNSRQYLPAALRVTEENLPIPQVLELTVEDVGIAPPTGLANAGKTLSAPRTPRTPRNRPRQAMSAELKKRMAKDSDIKSNSRTDPASPMTVTRSKSMDEPEEKATKDEMTEEEEITSPKKDPYKDWAASLMTQLNTLQDQLRTMNEQTKFQEASPEQAAKPRAKEETDNVNAKTSMSTSRVTVDTVAFIPHIKTAAGKRRWPIFNFRLKSARTQSKAPQKVFQEESLQHIKRRIARDPSVTEGEKIEYGDDLVKRATEPTGTKIGSAATLEAFGMFQNNETCEDDKSTIESWDEGASSDSETPYSMVSFDPTPSVDPMDTYKSFELVIKSEMYMPCEGPGFEVTLDETFEADDETEAESQQVDLKSTAEFDHERYDLESFMSSQSEITTPRSALLHYAELRDGRNDDSLLSGSHDDPKALLTLDERYEIDADLVAGKKIAESLKDASFRQESHTVSLCSPSNNITIDEKKGMEKKYPPGRGTSSNLRTTSTRKESIITRGLRLVSKFRWKPITAKAPFYTAVARDFPVKTEKKELDCFDGGEKKSLASYVAAIKESIVSPIDVSQDKGIEGSEGFPRVSGASFSVLSLTPKGMQLDPIDEMVDEESTTEAGRVAVVPESGHSEDDIAEDVALSVNGVSKDDLPEAPRRSMSIKQKDTRSFELVIKSEQPMRCAGVGVELKLEEDDFNGFSVDANSMKTESCPTLQSSRSMGSNSFLSEKITPKHAVKPDPPEEFGNARSDLASSERPNTNESDAECQSKKEAAVQLEAGETKERCQMDIDVRVGNEQSPEPFDDSNWPASGEGFNTAETSKHSFMKARSRRLWKLLTFRRTSVEEAAPLQIQRTLCAGGSFASVQNAIEAEKLRLIVANQIENQEDTFPQEGKGCRMKTDSEMNNACDGFRTPIRGNTFAVRRKAYEQGKFSPMNVAKKEYEKVSEGKTQSSPVPFVKSDRYPSCEGFEVDTDATTPRNKLKVGSGLLNLFTFRRKPDERDDCVRIKGTFYTVGSFSTVEGEDEGKKNKRRERTGEETEEDTYSEQDKTKGNDLEANTTTKISKHEQLQIKTNKEPKVNEKEKTARESGWNPDCEGFEVDTDTRTSRIKADAGKGFWNFFKSRHTTIDSIHINGTFYTVGDSSVAKCGSEGEKLDISDTFKTAEEDITRAVSSNLRTTSTSVERTEFTESEVESVTVSQQNEMKGGKSRRNLRREVSFSTQDSIIPNDKYAIENETTASSQNVAENRATEDPAVAERPKEDVVTKSILKIPSFVGQQEKQMGAQGSIGKVLSEVRTESSMDKFLKELGSEDNTESNASIKQKLEKSFKAMFNSAPENKAFEDVVEKEEMAEETAGYNENDGAKKEITPTFPPKEIVTPLAVAKGHNPNKQDKPQVVKWKPRHFKAAPSSKAKINVTPKADPEATPKRGSTKKSNRLVRAMSFPKRMAQPPKGASSKPNDRYDEVLSAQPSESFSHLSSEWGSPCSSFDSHQYRRSPIKGSARKSTETGDPFVDGIAKIEEAMARVTSVQGHMDPMRQTSWSDSRMERAISPDTIPFVLENSQHLLCRGMEGCLFDGDGDDDFSILYSRTESEDEQEYPPQTPTLSTLSLELENPIGNENGERSERKNRPRLRKAAPSKGQSMTLKVTQ
jgi:hypothetical protein